MSTIRVKPLPDGVAMRGNWEVTKDGMRKDTNTKKNAALSSARRVGSGGDTVVVHGVGGEVQRSFTLSGDSSSGGRGGRGHGVDTGDPVVDAVDDLGDVFE